MTLRTRVRIWLRANATEFRAGMLLVAVGVPLSLAGALVYVLPEPGFPVLFIGLSCLFTGLVMMAANVSERERR